MQEGYTLMQERRTLSARAVDTKCKTRGYKVQKEKTQKARGVDTNFQRGGNKCKMCGQQVPEWWALILRGEGTK